MMTKYGIFLLTGCSTLAAWPVLPGDTAYAQAPIIRRTAVTPAPTPAPAPQSDEDAAEETPAATTPPPIRRAVRTPAPAPATTTAPIRQRPIVDPAAQPATTTAPPPIRRITTPTVTPTPAPAPVTTPVRRPPTVITTPTPDADDAPAPVQPVRIRPPVTTTTPATERRPAPVLAPPTTTGGRPTVVQPVRPVVTPVGPVRPRPDDVATLPPSIIIPPSDGQAPTLANSLTLRQGGYADMLRNMRVVRQIPIQTLRTNPTLQIGTIKADFRPVLNNPRALPNIAQKLRSLPSLVDVQSDVLEAVEIEQGLLVRSVLTYSFKPGACSDTGRRAQIAASGISCFSRDNGLAGGAAFADPRSTRYVADPRRRAETIAFARERSVQTTGEIASDLAAFRGQLNDPAQRAALAGQIGASEVSRLSALDDASLTNELVNSAETRVEQVAYIPRADTVPIIRPVKLSPKSTSASADFSREFDIDTHVFVTGFTLGKEYEWKQRVQTTIKWCLVGCKKTYYAELTAGFDYGFGLRFPMRVGGTFNYSQTGGKDKGVLTAKVETINASAADYTAAGMPGDKLFAGKELVAQFSARAGIGAKLPFVGQIGPIGLTVGKDFTEGLPAPFTNGQFRPPQPGENGLSGPIIFDQFDLLGGRGNFGVIGGQVFPAVEVGLVSNSLSLTLRDKVNGATRPLNAGVNTVELAIGEDRAANFAIENPKYNVAFKVTPGLNARLFIDLSVWGTHWDWPVWFPQLSIELPPNGVDFACHEGTTCTRDYRFTDKGEQSEMMAQFESWGKAFDAKWEPQCKDEPCKFAVRLVRQNAIYSGRLREDKNSNISFAQMSDLLAAAEKKAGELIAISSAKNTSSAMGQFAIGYWSKQCKDILCYDNIVALANQMGPRAGQVQMANPALSPQAVNSQVNKEFGPKFQKEVDDSKLRADMAVAAEVARQAKRGKQPVLIR